jgi:hypothetical protein
VRAVDARLAALELYAWHYVQWLRRESRALDRMVKEGRMGAEGFTVLAAERFTERAGERLEEWLRRLRRALELPAREPRALDGQTALALADVQPLFDVIVSRREAYLDPLKDPVEGVLERALARLTGPMALDLTDLALRIARAAMTSSDRVERRGEFQRMEDDVRKLTRQVGSDEPLAPLVEALRAWRRTARPSAGR